MKTEVGEETARARCSRGLGVRRMVGRRGCCVRCGLKLKKGWWTVQGRMYGLWEINH